MTYDFGTRRGTSGRSGFGVSRLKTSMSDMKYGNVRKRVKRGSESETIPRVKHWDNSMDSYSNTKNMAPPGERVFRNRTSSKPNYDENERSTRHVSRDYGRKRDPIENGRRRRTTGIEDRPRHSDVSSGNLRSEEVKNASNNCDEEESSQSNSNRIRRREELRKNKKEMYKKSLRENPLMTEEDKQKKKKKRGIRLDPKDISNKRIIDTTSAPPAPPANEKVEEKDPEISKNAQFRAIIPSPSILSTVENDLLGRRRTIDLKNAGYSVDLSAPLDNIPFSTNTARERIEESVFRNKLEFFAAAKISASFPPPVLPEIAFAGRSNVGKSSLLNALTRQWGVVRTSDKPGHTQTINFFRLASKLCMVDLPGYGFAYAKEEVKDSWEELVKEYVSTRDGLQRVCLLIDTKWGMKTRDHELIQLMERSKTPYQVVLTKTDIVFPIDVARRAMQIQEDLKTMKSKIDPVMMVSSKSGAGIRSLRTVLSKLARFIKP